MNIKKIIISSLLISGISNIALAEGLKVTIGGSVNTRLTYINENPIYKNISGTGDIEAKEGYNPNTSSNQSNTMETATRLKFTADNEDDKGFKYGASIEIGDKNGTDMQIRTSYLYAETGYGKAMIGASDSASKTLKADASDIAAATGGLDGDTTGYINTTIGYIPDGTGSRTNARYLTAPALPLDNLGTVGSHFNKITYYTPWISGFQAGISYAIDSQEVGGFGNMKNSYFTLGTAPDQYASPGYTEVFSLGTKYVRDIQKFNITLSAVTQFANGKKANGAPSPAQSLSNIKAYALGTIIAYDKYSVATSYGNWDKSMNTKLIDGFNNKDTHYYTFGTAYKEKDKYTLSLTYMASKMTTNKYSIVSLGADYTFAPGLMSYVEGNIYRFTPSKVGTVYQSSNPSNFATAAKSSGNVVMIGTKLKF